jgi:arylformamidase
MKSKPSKRKQKTVSKSTSPHIIDVSVSMSPTMPVYPGDPTFSIEPMLQIAKGAKANVSRLSFGDHTGTHVDPPIHFIPGGKTVDLLDLNVLYGTARVVDMTHVSKEITASDLEHAKIPKRVTRLIFKTRNSDSWEHPEFYKDYVGIGWDAADWLVKRGIRLAGIDYLSVETFGASEPYTHRTLLGAEIIALEGLNLKEVEPGDYTLVCLPLKIKEGDGAPARTILIHA